MRITFCLPNSTLSGGTRVALIHARKLMERGHEVRVVTQKPKTPARRLGLRRLLSGRRPTQEARSYNPLAFLDEAHIVADRNSPDFAAHVPDADVIVATWWETAFSVMALPPEKGRKFYFVQHHEVHENLPSHLSAGSYYLPMQKIAVAGWLSDTMRELYGDPDVPVVPNSVDTDQFHASGRGPGTPSRIGFLHSPRRYKGGDVAMRAIALARQARPDLGVVAFGTPEGSGLPEGTIYFRTPPQDKLREIYAMCDGWLMPSYSEGFGLPVLEAMACRTPVISTRTGVGPDVIEDGLNGYLVDVGDAEAMATRILELVSLPPAKWRSMSDAAFARATSYSWDDATGLFESILLGDADRRPVRQQAG